MKNMKNNLWAINIFLPLYVIIMLTSFLQKSSSKVDIVPLMQYGMENEDILELYAEDINDVYTMTNSKRIRIWYYDCDLNQDGYTDKFVIVSSTLHSGSAGDSIDAWLGDENGDYQEVALGQHLPIIGIDDKPAYWQIFILPSMSNGLCDIECQSLYDDTHFLLRYNGERYEYIKLI